MKQDNSPIALSGRVFVDKLLACEHPGLVLPDRVRRGDVKLIAVPKSGHKHRPGCCPSFEGFFAAYVFDGRGWRKLALREGAACEATYVDRPNRRSRLHGVVDVLHKLQSRQASWGARAFTVPCATKPQPLAPERVATVGCAPAAATAATIATAARKGKRKEPDPNQLLLF